MKIDYFCNGCNNEFIDEQVHVKGYNMRCPQCNSKNTVIAGGGPRAIATSFFLIYGFTIGMFVILSCLYILCLFIAGKMAVDGFATLPKGYVYLRTGSRTSLPFSFIWLGALLVILFCIGWLANRFVSNATNWISNLFGIRFRAYYMEMSAIGAVIFAPIFIMTGTFILMVTKRFIPFMYLIGLKFM